MLEGLGMPSWSEYFQLAFHASCYSPALMVATARVGEKLGADSAKVPQVAHQNAGPLLTVQCLRFRAAVASVRSCAFTAHLTTALPLQLWGQLVV